MWLCDLYCENNPTKCLWSIKEVCVESMNTKVNIYEFEHDSMYCVTPGALHPLWHYIEKDNWVGIPTDTALRKTTRPTSPLALHCERPLGRHPLWHCAVKDHWACVMTLYIYIYIYIYIDKHKMSYHSGMTICHSANIWYIFHTMYLVNQSITFIYLCSRKHKLE
jgi:hypothetical protein